MCRASADAFVAAGAHLVADMCVAAGVHICIVQPLAVKILSAVRRKKVSIKLYHQTFDMARNKKAADRKKFFCPPLLPYLKICTYMCANN